MSVSSSSLTEARKLSYRMSEPNFKKYPPLVAGPVLYFLISIRNVTKLSAVFQNLFKAFLLEILNWE